jgi:hypothetical protein
MDDVYEFPIINSTNYPKTFNELKYCGDQAANIWLGLFFPLIQAAATRFVADTAAEQKHLALGIFMQSVPVERIDALILQPDKWEKAFPDPERAKEQVLSVLSLGFNVIRASPERDRWLDRVDYARQNDNLFYLSVGGQFLVQQFKEARRR